MNDLLTELQQAHRESPSWRLYGLCHQAATRIADLEAENERLRNMLNGYGKLDAELAIAERRIEALSRTGGVKVKALEWEKCQPGVYFSSSHSAKTEIGEYLAQSRAVYFRGNLIASASGLDAAKAAAQADYERRILSALEPAATCKESLQVEPAAPEGQQPVADAIELSGNTGELIDRMAAAIRDWGSHYDDGPWETLPEDRKAGWRGDAERALAVVKEYLTARRPTERAVMEAEIQRLTTEIARKHGCDRGTFTVCWGKVEKGLPCRCEDEARHALTAALGAQPPPEGAVTEAMVEAAANSIANIWCTGDLKAIARAALKAAMEAGR